MAFIYHIASAADWAQAQPDGQYAMSTRGRTLAEEGFIHASTAAQVAQVANAFYRDSPGPLVLLVIDPDLVGPEIRYEHVPGQAEPYPHIYGPLNTDAVLEARPFGLGPDGRFSFALSRWIRALRWIGVHGDAPHAGGSPSAPRRKSSWSRSRFSATVSWDAMWVMPDSGSTVCG